MRCARPRWRIASSGRRRRVCGQGLRHRECAPAVARPQIQSKRNHRGSRHTRLSGNHSRPDVSQMISVAEKPLPSASRISKSALSRSSAPLTTKSRTRSAARTSSAAGEAGANDQFGCATEPVCGCRARPGSAGLSPPSLRPVRDREKDRRIRPRAGSRSASPGVSPTDGCIIE